MSYDSHSGETMWDYLVGRAAFDSPMSVSFYDPTNDRLYRDVHMNVLGAHGWELTGTVVIPTEGLKPSLQYFFKRPRIKDAEGPVAAVLDVS